MGSTPGWIVYDPEGQPVYSLLGNYIWAFNFYVDCLYVMIKEGTHTLRRSHPFYWQVQGQMSMSGCDWSLTLSFTQKMIFIQRIPCDMEVIQTI